MGKMSKLRKFTLVYLALVTICAILTSLAYSLWWINEQHGLKWSTATLVLIFITLLAVSITFEDE